MVWFNVSLWRSNVTWACKSLAVIHQNAFRNGQLKPHHDASNDLRCRDNYCKRLLLYAIRGNTCTNHDAIITAV